MLNDKERFVNGVTELARECRVQISDWRMEAFIEVFKPYGYDRGIDALKMAFIKSRGNGQMPSPADLLNFVGEGIPDAPSVDDKANEIANRIIKAVGSFGSYRPGEAAQAMGAQAWAVVKAFGGGWESLCDMEIDQESFFRAQLRDLAKAQGKREHFDDFQERLSSSQNQNKLMINGMLNELSEKTKSAN